MKRNSGSARSLCRLSIFVAAILLHAAFVLSEEHSGAISGHTLDASGAVVPGVVVSARHLSTGFRQSAISDAPGVYRISGLPAGDYDVTAEISGFTTGLVTGIAVGEGETASADFALHAVGAAPAPVPTPPPSSAPRLFPTPPRLPAPPPQGQAGEAPPMMKTEGARLALYGFAQVDTIYDFDQVNPDWFDVLRPTQLPSFPNEYGKNGNFWASVRQTRFGIRGFLPTSLGVVKSEFEFDLFGTGSNAGETTFHLRKAWGEIGPFLAGQAYSVFMDGDVFPNSIEYWGPNGIVIYNNIQLRYAPLQGENEIFVALERPGASGDAGEVQDRVDLQNIETHFPVPDLTFHYRRSGDWGHAQLAGIVRYIGWVDQLPDDIDVTGHATGWGLNLSTLLKVGKTGSIRASVAYGEGIENYFNDAPADIGAATHSGNPRRPFVGEPLPVFGLVAFYDFYWSKYFSSAIGYSRVDIDNSDLQLPSAFKTGQYALVNLLGYPFNDVMAGVEFLWGRRTNHSDGFSVNDFRLQFSARYSFGLEFGGRK